MRVEENKPLILRRKLPQIYITEDKFEVLLDWMEQNPELRKTKIPHVLEEGYIVYYNHELDVDLNKEGKEAIKYVAHNTGITYNQAKARFEDLLRRTNPLWIYFYWEGDICYVHVYDTTRQLHLISIQAHDEETEEVYRMPDRLDTQDLLKKAFDDESGDHLWPRYLAMRAAMLVTSVFKYMNIQKTSKPYQHRSKSEYNPKRKIQLEEPELKMISTPVFDLTKKKITVERLNKQHQEYVRRTAAWNVRGHSRHYKSGKVIWVNSYIKGDKSQYEGEIYSIVPKEER